MPDPFDRHVLCSDQSDFKDLYSNRPPGATFPLVSQVIAHIWFLSDAALI